MHTYVHVVTVGNHAVIALYRRFGFLWTAPAVVFTQRGCYRGSLVLHKCLQCNCNAVDLGSRIIIQTRTRSRLLPGRTALADARALQASWVWSPTPTAWRGSNLVCHRPTLAGGGSD